MLAWNEKTFVFYSSSPGKIYILASFFLSLIEMMNAAQCDNECILFSSLMVSYFNKAQGLLLRINYLCLLKDTINLMDVTSRNSKLKSFVTEKESGSGEGGGCGASVKKSLFDWCFVVTGLCKSCD